jgi:hypothetical protein
MPYDPSGGHDWGGWDCFPMDPDPGAVGEACDDLDLYDGEDPCDKAMICFPHPWMSESQCTAFCRTVEVDFATKWTCDAADSVCVATEDSSANVCLPVCDPLDQAACPPGTGCYAQPSPFLFSCLEDASAGAGDYGAPCVGETECAPGLSCRPAADVPGCADDSCCTPYCDVGSGDPCPGEAMGQQCEPYTDPHPNRIFPAALEHVGRCVVP